MWPVSRRMLECSAVTSRCKRSPCQVHGIEQKLRFKCLAKMCRLTKSVLLVLEYKQTGRDISALKRGVHPLSLIDRHDRIVLTVEEYHGSGQPIGEIDRRTVVVKCAVRPKRLDKPVGVMQLEFMSFGGECDQIADSVVARTDGEFGVKSEPAQRRIAASAAARDRQLSAVDIATSGKEFCARNAIHDVNDAPLGAADGRPLPSFARAAAQSCIGLMFSCLAMLAVVSSKPVPGRHHCNRHLQG